MQTDAVSPLEMVEFSAESSVDSPVALEKLLDSFDTSGVEQEAKTPGRGVGIP